MALLLSSYRSAYRAFGMANTFKVPLLYRHILKAAKDFPSKKRAAIIQDIKVTFHEDKVCSRKRSFLC